MPACGEAALRRLQGLAAVARDVDREVEVMIDQHLSGDPPAKRGSTLVGCEAMNRSCSLCGMMARFMTGLHRALGLGSPEKARRGAVPQCITERRDGDSANGRCCASSQIPTGP